MLSFIRKNLLHFWMKVVWLKVESQNVTKKSHAESKVRVTSHANFGKKVKSQSQSSSHESHMTDFAGSWNRGNVYNQNSQKGTYCFCQRPYPDDEDPIVDEMYQCVICEDWYHSRCLFPDQVAVESNEAKFIDDEFLNKLVSDDSEVICKNVLKSTNLYQMDACVKLILISRNLFITVILVDLRGLLAKVVWTY